VTASPASSRAFRRSPGCPTWPDLARLEYLRVRSWHAADVDAITAERITAVLADPDGLPDSLLSLHPALFVLPSEHAVVSLWAAHQAESPALALAAVDPAQAESALLCRNGLEVEIRRVGHGTALFIGLLQQAATYAAATAESMAADADFDPATTLALLVRCGAITAITTPRRTDA
jgi:hypothetical protein